MDMGLRHGHLHAHPRAMVQGGLLHALRGWVTLLARAGALESAGQYAEARAVIGEGAREFGDRDWTADIERLQRAMEIEGDYQRATGALASGDRETAKQFFAK